MEILNLSFYKLPVYLLSPCFLEAITFSLCLKGFCIFILTDEIVEIADWIPIIPVSLAAFSIVLIVWFVLFVRNAGKKETYTALISHVTEEVDASAKNSTV